MAAMTEYKDFSLPETSFDGLVLDAVPPVDSDAMDVDSKALSAESNIPDIDNLTLTNNSALAYKSSLSACLDFFYTIQATTEAKTVDDLLDAAWKEDALVTLRLIFQLRDIRKGKGVKYPFLYCLDWLRRHHFQTLLANLKHVTDVGCWKDALDLLVIEVLGTQEYQNRLKAQKVHARSVKTWMHSKSSSTDKVSKRKMKKKVYISGPKIDKDAAAAAARVAFLENGQYKQLHVCIASLFAEALKTDLASMQAQKGVSLASKWAPTANKHHDNFTLIVSTISQILFPQSEYRKEGQSYAAYTSAVRNLYRKIYLSPLRQYSNVIERFMSLSRWNDIKYDRVPSKSMLRNKGIFEEKDAERFKSFLGDVEKGKKTIKSSALDPHEMVQQFIDSDKELSEDEAMTTELQWKAYVTKLKEKGTLDNCMAMCDVSGSMYGIPIRVAVSLSLLVAELAEEPYKGIVCTFSGSPELFRVPDGKLPQKVQAMMGMDWGMYTNVNAAFDLILEKATTHNIPKEAMIKRLFIFSDMQFGEAQEGKTNFESAKSSFEEAGYDLPQIVFWNIREVGTRTTIPVTKDEQGTALVSGFSGQLLKLFMNDINTFDPISILMNAIECYDYLKVVD